MFQVAHFTLFASDTSLRTATQQVLDTDDLRFILVYQTRCLVKYFKYMNHARSLYFTLMCSSKTNAAQVLVECELNTLNVEFYSLSEVMGKYWPMSPKPAQVKPGALYTCPTVSSSYTFMRLPMCTTGLMIMT